MRNDLCISLFLIYSVNCNWITINDYSVTTWNESNADRPQILTRFSTTNYPSKYIRSLNNRIDTYTYDPNNKIVYFIMQQTLYGISKFFKYNLITNQIDQTEEIQPFMIEQIQFNSITNKLYSIIHNQPAGPYLVEVDTNTLRVKQQIAELGKFGSSMPGSYFNSQTELFTYHAYDSNIGDTVLIKLNLSDNAIKRFVQSNRFDFNVYGFGYIESDTLIGLYQYSIITPMVAIKLNEKNLKQIKNVTITPEGVRIAQGYKPFSMDLKNRLFYVLSWSDDLSTTFISKVNVDTMKVKIITIKGQIMKDYLFLKTN